MTNLSTAPQLSDFGQGLLLGVGVGCLVAAAVLWWIVFAIRRRRRLHRSISPTSDWDADCIEWHGRVLTGPRAHWCGSFDDLPIDDTCGEAIVCLCFDGTPEARTPDELAAILAAHSALATT